MPYIKRRINELLDIEYKTVCKTKQDRQCVYKTRSVYTRQAMCTQDRQCVYKRNAEAISRNRRCRGKAKSIKYSACVFVALVIWHAKSMFLMIFSSVACLAKP